VDGIHDLGGRMGFGPVVVEPDEPVFHEPWERTARALVSAVVVNLSSPSTPGFRHAIERMDPGHYLTSSYYEHWLTAAASLAVEAGMVTADELEERAGGAFPLSRPANPDRLALEPGQARFSVGDRVRVRDWHPRRHTRCPEYVRGHVGEVVRCDGRFTVPDVEAHSPEPIDEATYSVRFAATELWGDSEGAVVVHVDLWDSYLEPV
jgi:nitrile hydratase